MLFGGCLAICIHLNYLRNGRFMGKAEESSDCPGFSVQFFYLGATMKELIQFSA